MIRHPLAILGPTDGDIPPVLNSWTKIIGSRSPLSKSRQHRTRRRGLSLLELVVSMGLLTILMLPVVGLLATSYKVYNASSQRHDGNYARQTALDAAEHVLRGAEQVVAVSRGSVNVRFADGTVGRLAYSRGRLTWTAGGASQTLADHLSDASFSVGTAAGASPSAGELLLVELATRGAGEPSDTWSNTRIWIRPLL